MRSVCSPLHVGRLNSCPLRFFRPPIAGTHLPWHAWEDLQVCLRLPEDVRVHVGRRLVADWCADVRTVATAEGIVTIAPHWMASGLISAMSDLNGSDLDLTVGYQQALFSAWAALTGDMPAEASLSLMQTAICNALADQAGQGRDGGSAA